MSQSQRDRQAEATMWGTLDYRARSDRDLEGRGVTSADECSSLVVTDLRVVIGDGERAAEAISDVSITIHPGQCIGIVGESGSGKSLLCRSIMGLTAPRVHVSGSVRVGGIETVDMRERRRRSLLGRTFGMVFQDPMTALSPVKRIGAQLIYPIRHHTGVTKQKARDRAVELLRAVGIPDPERCMSQYPHELSGGMRQRIVVALAMSGAPKYIFADEPTTALDVTVQAQVLDLLDSLRADGTTALALCSHDLNVIAGRADVVVVMYAGQVVEVAPAEQIFASARMPYTEGLLGATPQLDEPSHTRLRAIPGRPPSISDRPTGCRFEPRCPYATEKCRAEMPPMVDDGDGRAYRCWHPLNVPGNSRSLRPQKSRVKAVDN